MTLKPLEAGGPHELIVRGKNEVRIRDVLIGDVWIAAGQSNMEWPLQHSDSGTEASLGSTDYELRLYSLTDVSVRVLIGSPGIPWVQPVGWTPDGNHVLAWLARKDEMNELAMVSVKDSAVRVM